MTRKQPTSSRGGRKYGENTMARRPDLRGQESDSGSEEPRRLALVPIVTWRVRQTVVQRCLTVRSAPASLAGLIAFLPSWCLAASR